MTITPSTRQQAAALSLVLSSVKRCAACPPGCDGKRWIWDEAAGATVRQLCPRADTETCEREAAGMLAEAGIPSGTRPIVCPWLREGLTVVCPDWKATTLAEELEIRRVTAGIVAGWIVERQTPALYQPYYMTRSFWRDDIAYWKRVPLAAFVSWHFRGLREEHAAAFNDVLLHRLDNNLLTVVSLSAHPSFLLPRWPTDEAIVDALRKPDFFVRVGRSNPRINKVL